VALKSLNRLLWLRTMIIRARNVWLWVVVGVRINPSVNLSLSSKLSPGARGSIAVGRDTLIAFKTYIYSLDPLSGKDMPVSIGDRCFIGGGSVITPGVTVGDECIVGAGAVVFEDVPARCMVGGNPARILRREIEVVRYGRLSDATAKAQTWQD
jgi:acetyltransferase-like isoleucine patch superfamily enzyme